MKTKLKIYLTFIFLFQSSLVFGTPSEQIGDGFPLLDVNVHEHFHYLFSPDELLSVDNTFILQRPWRDIFPKATEFEYYMNCIYPESPIRAADFNDETIEAMLIKISTPSAPDDAFMKRFLSLPNPIHRDDQCNPKQMYKILDFIRKKIMDKAAGMADDSGRDFLNKVFRRFKANNPDLKKIVISASIDYFEKEALRTFVLQEFKNIMEDGGLSKKVLYLKGAVFSNSDNDFAIRSSSYSADSPNRYLGTEKSGIINLSGATDFKYSIAIGPDIADGQELDAFLSFCKDHNVSSSSYPFSLILEAKKKNSTTSEVVSWTHQFPAHENIAISIAQSSASFHHFVDAATGKKNSPATIDDLLRTLTTRTSTKRHFLSHRELCPLFQNVPAEERTLFSGYDLTGSLDEPSISSPQMVSQMKEFYKALFAKIDQQSRDRSSPLILRMHLLEQAEKNYRIEALLETLAEIDLSSSTAMTLMIGHTFKAAQPWDASEVDSSFLDKLSVIIREAEAAGRKLPHININLNPASNAYLAGLDLLNPESSTYTQRYRDEYLIPLLLKLKQTNLLSRVQLGGDGTGMLFEGKSDVSTQLNHLLSILNSTDSARSTDSQVYQIIQILESQTRGDVCL